MKEQTFEEYLADRHAVGYTGTDDDMPDAFDNWISNLNADQIIGYAQRWGDQLKRIYSNEVLAEIIKKNHG